jgi:hypothetical protein
MKKGRLKLISLLFSYKKTVAHLKGNVLFQKSLVVSWAFIIEIQHEGKELAREKQEIVYIHCSFSII